MKKWLYIAASIIIAALLVIIWLSFQGLLVENRSSTIYSYKIIATYPHDSEAFTEGLIFVNGSFYESTGGWGTSSLREVNLADGSIIKEVALPEHYFGEGLTIVNGSLIQLTWQNGIGFVYDLKTFRETENFNYSTEGWGLTFDGVHLIMSDGTSNLYLLDPSTYQKVGQVSVHDANAPIDNLNELEYVNGSIYANIWHQQRIAIINLSTGQVKGYIDLTGIYQNSDPEAVLNGIAFDQTTNRLFITGKNWPYLFQITITPKT
jgi:glutaminyl-peptide cyclotransferase